MNHIKSLTFGLALGCAVVSSAFAGTDFAADLVQGPCTGEMFNPFSDADWSYIYPITIAGAAMTTGNTDPPLMKAAGAICECPSALLWGYPMVGVVLSYWEGMYIQEIERRPGCLRSMGGLSILEGYSTLASEQSDNNSVDLGKSANRMQIHWYEYPLFSLLDMLLDTECPGSSSFNLVNMTELDALWQDDLWGAVFAPEASLFGNLSSIASCGVDSVASSLDFPLDELFWCAGSWGSIYPLTGNSGHSGDPFIMNNQLGAKYIARSHRMGLMMQTIGPSAVCSPHINNIWVKSQYRYNQVAPIPRKGRAVVTGSNGRYFQTPAVTNAPTKEYTVNMIWQGKQCCLKAIP